MFQVLWSHGCRQPWVEALLGSGPRGVAIVAGDQVEREKQRGGDSLHGVVLEVTVGE